MDKAKVKEILMVISIIFFTKYGEVPASIALDIIKDVFGGRGYSQGREFVVLIVWAPISLSFLGMYFLIKKTEIVGVVASIALFSLAMFYEIFIAF